MRIKKVFLRCIYIWAAAGILVVCAISQDSNFVFKTNVSVPTSEVIKPPTSVPIVTTAIADSLPALPALTDTPGFAGTAGQIIRMDDNGKTLTLQTGQRFVLMLDDRYVWEVSIDPPGVANLATDSAKIGRSQGVYEAHMAGQTQIMATGDPLCRSQKPACMLPSLIFTLNLIVN
jgi:hypothetical protein